MGVDEINDIEIEPKKEVKMVAKAPDVMMKAKDEEKGIVKKISETIPSQLIQFKRSTKIMIIIFASIFLLLAIVGVSWSNIVEGNKDYSSNITLNNPITVETPDVNTPISNNNNFTIVNENKIDLSESQLTELADKISQRVINELNVTNSS